MDKISINNLFPSNNDFQPIDVNSLFNTKEQRSKNKINLNIDRLIHLREDRKKKIFIQYDKILNMCLNKINLANNLDKTEVVYDVPDALFGHFNYNTAECVDYLHKKITDLYFDAMIISDKSIYISWKNLEENRKKSKITNEQ